MWTVVARRNRTDDEAESWCTHWHEDADEANSCSWVPDDPSLILCIVNQLDFDPSACTPCVHELHPAECLRCLSLECIHLNDPAECERCYEFHRQETTNPPADAEAQEASASPEGFDSEGGINGRSVCDAQGEGTS